MGGKEVSTCDGQVDIDAVDGQIVEQHLANKAAYDQHQEESIKWEKQKALYKEAQIGKEEASRQIQRLSKGLQEGPRAKLAFSEAHQDAAVSETSDISISRSGSDISQSEIDSAIKRPKKFEEKITKYETAEKKLRARLIKAHDNLERYQSLQTPKKYRGSRQELARLVDAISAGTSLDQRMSKAIIDTVKHILPANTPFKKNKLSPKNIQLTEVNRANLKTVLNSLQTGEFANPQMTILLHTLGQTESIKDYHKKSGELYLKEQTADSALQDKKGKIERFKRIAEQIPSKPGQRLTALKKRVTKAKVKIDTGRVGGKRGLRDIGTPQKRQRKPTGRGITFFPDV